MIHRNHKKMHLRGVLPPASAGSVVVLLAVLALAYLWVGSCAEKLGRAIKGLEIEQAGLRQRLSVEEAKWAEMKSIGNLERALQHFGLAMTPPRPGQVVRLRGRFYDGWMDSAPAGASLAGEPARRP